MTKPAAGPAAQAPLARNEPAPFDPDAT
jgi:hypothetical protein